MPYTPVDNTLLSNAVPYTPNQGATPFSLCKIPKEGLKGLPMSFNFSIIPLVNRVDLSQGSPNPPLSQMAAIWVDCTNSEHDVIIYFPDTGFQITCSAESSELYPVFTGKNPPVFFVILNFVQIGGMPPTDVVNIIALNQFIPSFTGNLNHFLSLNQTDLFENIPQFLGQASFSTIFGNANFPIALIPYTIGGSFPTCKQFYVSSITVDFIGSTVDMSTQYIDFFLLCGQPKLISNGGLPSQPKFYPSSAFVVCGQGIVSSNLSKQNLIHENALNFVSGFDNNAGNQLTILATTQGNANFVNGVYCISLTGGILA